MVNKQATESEGVVYSRSFEWGGGFDLLLLYFFKELLFVCVDECVLIGYYCQLRFPSKSFICILK